MATIGEIFHIGMNVLTTSLDAITSTVLAQLGSVNDGDYVYSSDAEWYQHVGFASRPSNPHAGQAAAECVAIKGTRDTVIASRDVRGQKIYGNLGEGETCLYGSGADGKSQGRVLIKDDGSVTMFTTHNNLPPREGGFTVMLRISPTGGFQFASQWGSMVLDATGFHVITAIGPRFDMGGVPGLSDAISNVPGVGNALGDAINKMTSYATISAPIINVEGSSVFLGPAPLNPLDLDFYNLVAGLTPPTGTIKDKVQTSDKKDIPDLKYSPGIWVSKGTVI